MLRSRLAGPALAALGCTTSLSSGPAPGSAHSVQYYLPQQTFALEVEYELASCAPVRIEQRPAIQTLTVADTSAPYYLDYAGLKSGLKKTAVVVSLYPNGTLKSVGAQADDRTGPVVGSLLSLALRLASGGAAAASAGEPAPDGGACAPATRELLRERDRLNAALRSELATGVRREALLDALARTRAGLTQHASGALVPRLLSATPSDAYERDADLVALSRAQLAAWFDGEGSDALAEAASTCFRFSAPALARFASAPGPGLVYREPRLVQIDARRGDCDAGAAVGAAEAWVSQLGPLRTIAISSAPFEKRALSVAFTPAGTIETLSTQDESRSERVLEVSGAD